jgi:hypothetical protein
MKVISVPFLISIGTSVAIEPKLLLMDRLNDFSSKVIADILLTSSTAKAPSRPELYWS